MKLQGIKERFLNRLWSRYNGGQSILNLASVEKELHGLGIDSPDIQKLLKELEAEGHIKLSTKEVYLEIVKPGLSEFLGRLNKTGELKKNLKKALLTCFLEFLSHSDHTWSQREIQQVLSTLEYPAELEYPLIQSTFKELEKEGFIRIRDEENRYIEVAKPKDVFEKYSAAGIKKLPLEPMHLKMVLLAGFQRFYGEGIRRWSKEDLRKMLMNLAENNDPDAPSNQSILKELERNGHITLHCQPEFYLEVL